MNLVLRNRYPLPSGVRLGTLDQSFERLMHGLFEGGSTPVDQAATERVQNLALDVRETATVFEVEASLPGLRKKDVKIAIDAGRITIHAEPAQKREARDGEKLIHAERSTPKFSRTFSLPAELDETRIEARLENGILTLTLPKKPVIQPTQIVVQ